MILLTGATGMLGSHIAYELTSKGENIRALKRKGASISTTEKIFSWYSKDAKNLLAKIEWVEGDLLDTGSLEDAVDRITEVYHAAAVVTFNLKEKEKML